MERTENIMGTKPVKSLLIGMAFPIMCSMLVQALYNIVDSVFVAILSENALTSVSLIFPIQNLMIAVAVGTAVGMNVLLSRRLGEKNYAAANRVANNGVFLAVCSALLFAVIGIFGSKPFMSAFTDNPAIAKDGATYMFICTVFSLGLFVEIMLERIVQVTGKTVYQMCSQMTGAMINIVLDPILIFGLLGAPKMGVTGAAIATVIGQWCGMLLCLVLNLLHNREVRLKWADMIPHWRTIRGIYQVGLPTIVMQSIGSVMVFGMNRILIAFTETAVSVFGVYFKLNSFIFMPVFGLTNALIPIVGYNYGARNKRRITDATRLSVFIAVGIMLAGTLLFQFAPAQLLSLFSASEEMISIGVPALRIISISFSFAAVAIVFSCMFQALGEGMLSLWMSLVRQLVILLPCAWLLAKWQGLDAVWYSFLIAEFFSLIMAILFFRHTYRTRIVPLDSPPLNKS
ncbi:MAG: MATE family efflux transporter [Ruthenibacterium sp.]